MLSRFGRPSRAYGAIALGILVLACGGCEPTSGMGSGTDGGTGSDTDLEPCPPQVLEGDLEVGTAQELEALEGVTHVTGSVRIEALDSADLGPLACLERVGSLFIRDSPQIGSLQALSRLTVVDDRLQMAGLDALQSLEGLHHVERARRISILRCDGLQSLAGLGAVQESAFSIGQCASLTSLEGLHALEFAAGFTIRANAALSNLRGLPNAEIRRISLVSNPNIESIAGLEGITSLDTLALDSNDSLESLAGLSNLEEIAFTGHSGVDGLEQARMIIRDNDALESLAGLEGVEAVEGYVELEDNGTLKNLDGLVGLERIDTNLTIMSNPELTSVAGLRHTRKGSLQELGGWLSIGVNPSLPTCDAQGFVSDLRALGYDGSVEVWGNLADECSDP